MKIAYLGAGAAGRICGTCFHDNGLAVALRELGEDILLIPTYTPIRTDEENVSYSRVFFGGVNVYLQQHSAIFRHTPWFLDRMLDNPALLTWLSKRSAQLQPSDLGPLTVSTIKGKHGRQKKEIQKLVTWLADEFKPDIVHISNIMLAGAAGPIKERLGVPVVCSLMGEDIFLEGLVEPYYSEARTVLKEKTRDLDGLVALNNYYADFMADYLATDRSRIEVIPHGLTVEKYPVKSGEESNQKESANGQPIRLGYFGRIAAEKGLHLLIEAFAKLVEMNQSNPQQRSIKLHVAGYKSDADNAYFERIVSRVAELGLEKQFQFHGELNFAAKVVFLRELDLCAMPTVYHESKGIAVLEAMAVGVPVVVPRHGTFPEYIEATGGGLLCEPDDPESLANQLHSLIIDPQSAQEIGKAGAQAIREKFNARLMAERHGEFYRKMKT